MPLEPGLSAAAAVARAELEAAEQLLREGDWVGAQALFSVLSASDLARSDRPRHTLLAAELAIQTGNLAEARELLLGLDPRRLPDPLAAELAYVRLLAADGEPEHAAARLMRQTISAGQRTRLHDEIWALITATPVFTALALADQGSEVERGWWTLRRELLSSASRADDRRRVQAWQSAWPNHPAARRLPAVLTATTTSDQSPPRQVALLLPLTGPLARAGRAVRDGFIATYLEQPENERFALAIYDTEAAPISVIYEQALAAGAQVLVGPLRRETVAALNALNPELPVLALNYLGGEQPAPNLAQLGLAIEDDAASIAGWLADANLSRVMVLHGPHDWAFRVRQALGEQGIDAVATHALPEMRTITESVGAAMLIAESQSRHTELQRLLGTRVEFQPRRREDIDALIALVTAVELTALGPALRFHYAHQVPTFVTSQTLQGANPTTLRGLDGLNVVELPWLAPAAPGYAALADAFTLAGNPFASMYALGADAFRLTDRLGAGPRGGRVQILGNTGALTLMPDGRVQRELARMRVERGQLVTATAIR